MKMPYKEILRVLQPIQLLLAAMSCLLGLGVARYLGISLDVPKAIGGTIVVLLVLLATNALNAYFSSQFSFPKNIDDPLERNKVLRLLFYVSILSLAIVAVVSFYFIWSGSVNAASLSALVLFITIALSVSIPPIRLEDHGLGEMARAILLTAFPTMIVFLMQAGDIHRLITYISFPLVFLALASLLVLDFPTYATDQKHSRRTMLVVLTWERSIPIHNLLLVSAYLLFIAAPFFGIPFGVIWPTLLTLPLAIYQGVMLRNISQGLHPDWRVLTINATALTGLAIYLLMFTLWMR